MSVKLVQDGVLSDQRTNVAVKRNLHCPDYKCGALTLPSRVRKRDGTNYATADAALVIATLKNELLNEYQMIEVTEPLVNRRNDLS